MGRAVKVQKEMEEGCCSENKKNKLRKGLWSPEEDERLATHIAHFGVSCWSSVPDLAGLQRCGKSCRLRWMNYLRPDLKRGRFSHHEEELILALHDKLGNSWSQIAARLPGRSDNEIKNFWNARLRKKLRQTVSSSPSSSSTAAAATGRSRPLPPPPPPPPAAFGTFTHRSAHDDRSAPACAAAHIAAAAVESPAAAATTTTSAGGNFVDSFGHRDAALEAARGGGGYDDDGFLAVLLGDYYLDGGHGDGFSFLAGGGGHVFS